VRKNKWLNKEELRKRKNAKFKDSENSKKKLRIDKLKSMLLEPRELLKRVNVLPERKKEKNLNIDKRFLKTWSMPDNNSSWIENVD
jgi:hypothetical protein